MDIQNTAGNLFSHEVIFYFLFLYKYLIQNEHNLYWSRTLEVYISLL